MKNLTRRQFLVGSTLSGLALSYPQIVKALSIPAAVKAGSIQDVEHVVIFMQENRSFDHYFGTMPGVRGFSDPYPVPLQPIAGLTERDVFTQLNTTQEGPELVSPFPLNTRKDFASMRIEGTPHSWPDAQYAWDNGKMDRWPDAKQLHSMGFYQQADIPFQYALANAFTICDAYHCSMQAGTNPNRLFLWSGTNDGLALKGGPAIGNSHDNLPENGGAPDDYDWLTYPERLQEAGVSWMIYQDMADNFTDNPLVGFKAYREAARSNDETNELKKRALTTRTLQQLKQDVVSNNLPSVSYIIATAAGSEHPGPSSPAQGAAYTADVLDALTANPEVWSKTVLFIMFDENDGFFDHMPPPAPPSVDPKQPGQFLGHSQIPTLGEYHLYQSDADLKQEREELVGRPYGLGPRVPAYVISPWSRGGKVCSEVLDHTSVIRFLELRFGVAEPNISPWRRAVCGDFMSAFNFIDPNHSVIPDLPMPYDDAQRAAILPGRSIPPIPSQPQKPAQFSGQKIRTAALYEIEVEEVGFHGQAAVQFEIRNKGNRAFVIHVYDRLALDSPPKRFTMAAHNQLLVEWPLHDAGFDLQLMGPEGFHRRLKGKIGSIAAIKLELQRNYLLLSTKISGLFYCLGQSEVAKSLLPGVIKKINVDEHGAYDITVFSGDHSMLRQYAGRLKSSG